MSRAGRFDIFDDVLKRRVEHKIGLRIEKSFRAVFIKPPVACPEPDGNFPARTVRGLFEDFELALAAVLHERTLPAGIFLGSAIHDTSQVVGASLRYAQQFGAPDVIGHVSATKLFRSLSIIILVPLMAWSTRARMQPVSSEPVACRPPLVPQFVIWFLVFVLLRTFGDQLVTTNTQAQQTWLQAMSAAQLMSELFMTCGMTAVGLTVCLAQMQRVGFRPICAAVLITAATAACSLGTISVLLF